MFFTEYFWAYGLALGALVLALTYLALPKPAQPSPVASALSQASEQAPSAKPAQSKAAANNASSHYPAPAKKLQQLLTDKPLAETQSLESQVQQLDKQLAELQQQLQAQGIDTAKIDALNRSAQTPSIPRTQVELQQRLNAIKQHLQP